MRALTGEGRAVRGAPRREAGLHAQAPALCAGHSGDGSAIAVLYCQFADALSPSLLIHLLKVEGVPQNDSLARSYSAQWYCW